MKLRRLGLLATFMVAASALVVGLPRPARAFGDVGAFDPRVLLVGGVTGAVRSAVMKLIWAAGAEGGASVMIQPWSMTSSKPSRP